MRKRGNTLYNYIVNTYGISKELIMEHVETRIQDMFDRIDHDYIESYVRQEVFKRIDRDIIDKVRWDLNKKIDKEVEKRIKDIKLEGAFDIEFKPKVSIKVKAKK